MNTEQQAELERLERVLVVAKRNGNELFIQNIEREISAVQRGIPHSGRAGIKGRRQPARGLKPTERQAIPTIDRSGPQGNAP